MISCGDFQVSRRVEHHLAPALRIASTITPSSLRTCMCSSVWSAKELRALTCTCLDANVFDAHIQIPALCGEVMN